MKMKTEAPSIEKLYLKRRKCTLSDDMIRLMLRQLTHEMYNHNLYRSFAS